MSVNSTIRNAAVDAVIKALEDEIVELQKQLDEKKSAVETVKKILGNVKPSLDKDSLYFVQSRSDTGGHFIQYDGVKTECSCEGFRYNGKCWASTYIKQAPGYNRAGFRYQVGGNVVVNFQNRVTPTNANLYLPRNANSLRA